MIETLLDFFSKPKEITDGKTPEGFCPNCWGKQEYDKNIRALYKEKQIDVNNKKANYAFIQKFVVKYVDGIQLKKEKPEWECPSCNVIK